MKDEKPLKIQWITTTIFENVHIISFSAGLSELSPRIYTPKSLTESINESKRIKSDIGIKTFSLMTNSLPNCEFFSKQS